MIWDTLYLNKKEVVGQRDVKDDTNVDAGRHVVEVGEHEEKAKVLRGSFLGGHLGHYHILCPFFCLVAYSPIFFGGGKAAQRWLAEVASPIFL